MRSDIAPCASGTVVEIHAQETTMDLYILIKTIVPFYEGDAWKIEILVRQGEEKKKRKKKKASSEHHAWINSSSPST
jgi:hypothetical protein